MKWPVIFARGNVLSGENRRCKSQCKNEFDVLTDTKVREAGVKGGVWRELGAIGGLGWARVSTGHGAGKAGICFPVYSHCTRYRLHQGNEIVLLHYYCFFSFPTSLKAPNIMEKMLIEFTEWVTFHLHVLWLEPLQLSYCEGPADNKFTDDQNENSMKVLVSESLHNSSPWMYVFWLLNSVIHPSPRAYCKCPVAL